jgi:pimeloyl-ACP methyl ester carboxylesterase
MAFAEINGAKLWYEVTGEGDPVIHIHGAGFGHFNFATATPVASKYFKCVDYDMRGYGQSDQPIQKYDMEVWADDVAGLMDHLNIERAHIHGTSMGGMIAQVFGGKYPKRTDRLILNCSAAKLDYAGKLAFKNWIEISEVYGCGSRTLAELIAVQALSRKFLDGPDGEAAVDMMHYAKEIKAPTLVIGGDEDIMTPWAVGPSGAGQEWLAQNIPNAVKYVVKGSNHSTLFDGTKENMRVVVNFLSGRNDLTAPLS